MPQQTGAVNPLWKFAATTLGSVLVTGLVAWFAFGTNTVTHEQMAELKDTLKILNTKVGDLTTQVSVLNAKLEAKGVLGGD